jgi:hypothetical protein
LPAGLTLDSRTGFASGSLLWTVTPLGDGPSTWVGTWTIVLVNNTAVPDDTPPPAGSRPNPDGNQPPP